MATDTHQASSSPSPGLSQLALPRSAVRALAACATRGELCQELNLQDRAAERLFAELGGNRSAFSNGELRCAAFRTQVVDQLTENFCWARAATASILSSGSTSTRRPSPTCVGASCPAGQVGCSRRRAYATPPG